MLDIGWSELMVIGVLALIVVGPKELPRLLRTVGQFVGKARRIAREFQRSMEDAARDADLRELTYLKRDMEKMGRVDFREQAKRSSGSLTSGGARKAGTAESVAADPAGKAVTNAAPAPASPEPETGAESDPPPPEAPPAPKAASGDRG